MVAGIIGAGIGALGNIAGGLLSNSLSVYKMQQLADYQAALNYRYAKKSALNSPTWNRQGLEKADFNPMLALGNMSGAQSSWTSSQNPMTADFSNVGSSAVSNALAVKQQDNQDRLTTAQEQNYNADSVLKNNQAITQMYEQLERLNHADLMKAQKQLTDKNVSWYDKQQAREDLRVANEIERTGNDFKVGMAQAIASQISANANQISANANAQDVVNRAPDYDKAKRYSEWAKNHPILSSVDETLSRYLNPVATGVGAYAISKSKPVVTDSKTVNTRRGSITKHSYR